MTNFNEQHNAAFVWNTLCKQNWVICLDQGQKYTTYRSDSVPTPALVLGLDIFQLCQHCYHFFQPPSPLPRLQHWCSFQMVESCTGTGEFPDVARMKQWWETERRSLHQTQAAWTQFAAAWVWCRSPLAGNYACSPASELWAGRSGSITGASPSCLAPAQLLKPPAFDVSPKPPCPHQTKAGLFQHMAC